MLLLRLSRDGMMRICCCILACSTLLAIPTNEVFGQLEVQKTPAGSITFPHISDPFAKILLAYPILITNISLLSVGVLYQRKQLPFSIQSAIRSLFSYEPSRKTSITVAIVMLSVYAAFLAPALKSEEFGQGDYENVKANTQNFVSGLVGHIQSLRLVKYFLLYASLELFGNIRIIPFITSILTMAIAGLLTAEIAKKRIAGLVAIAALAQSTVFLAFATSATYDYSWVLFYILSIYVMTKKRWFLSPLMFSLALFSKPVAATFIPASLFFIYRFELDRRKKIALAVPYIALLVAVAAIASRGSDDIVRLRFDKTLFLGAIQFLINSLGSEYLFLIALLPVSVGLFIIGIKKNIHAQSVLMLIATGLASYFFMQGFTNISGQPYRFAPLAIFFAIGIGTMFSGCAKTDRQPAVPLALFMFELFLAIPLLLYVFFPVWMQGFINQLAR